MALIEIQEAVPLRNFPLGPAARRRQYWRSLTKKYQSSNKGRGHMRTNLAVHIIHKGKPLAEAAK